MKDLYVVRPKQAKLLFYVRKKSERNIFGYEINYVACYNIS